MAHKTAEFLAIQAKDLEKLPVGPQRWVKKFFKPIKIFGIQCYGAFPGSLKEYLQKDPRPQGVAVDTIDWKLYVEGLPERMWLLQWFRKLPYVLSFFGSWEDNNIESALGD